MPWLIARMGHPLAWSSVDKCTVMLVLPLPFLVGFLFRIRYLLEHPHVEAYVDRAFITVLGRMLIAYLALCVALAIAARILRRSVPEHMGFVRLCTIITFSMLGIATYAVGSFNAPALAALLAAGMGAYIIFEPRIASLGFGVGIVIYYGGILAERIGLLPYGPVFGSAPFTPTGPPDSWVVVNAVMTTCILVLAIGLLNYVMVSWRRQDAEVRYLASVDPLTGVANRGHLLASLESELARAERYRRNLGLLMLDLDQFKRVNDTHGHVVGDHLLVRVGETLRTKCLRRGDLVGRYGGEEFAVILPEATAEIAAQVGERCRAEIEALEVRLADGTVLRPTASVGYATVPDPRVHRVEDFVRIADDALYDAKAEGRNCVKGRPLEDGREPTERRSTTSTTAATPVSS